MKRSVVREWFERGKKDLEVTKILVKEEYLDITLFHMHQAVEKYLKGFLISKGWKLKRVHDLEMLITETINLGAELQSYLDFGRRLTSFYYEERYPTGPVSPHPKEEVEGMLETAVRIITRIEELTTL
jgi:HEPN domain-containing protein